MEMALLITQEPGITVDTDAPLERAYKRHCLGDQDPQKYDDNLETVD
jgi:hypothetical protein